MREHIVIARSGARQKYSLLKRCFSLVFFRVVFSAFFQAVNCDGSLGGQKRFDGCGVCGGDNSTCRSISGIFTRPDMPTGYNLITRLPKSACNITIDELKPSANTIGKAAEYRKRATVSWKTRRKSQ